MLILRRNLIEKIKEQGELGYPYEICGFLLGSIDFKNDIRKVEEVIQVENQNKERANDRFEISPQDYQRVENYAYSKGLDIVGIYHTHPDHPSRPSETDLKFAQHDLSYIILSVKNGKADKWECWVLDNSSKEKKFIKENVEIIKG